MKVPTGMITEFLILIPSIVLRVLKFKLPLLLIRGTIINVIIFGNLI
jgi:hypothetical protein